MMTRIKESLHCPSENRNIYLSGNYGQLPQKSYSDEQEVDGKNTRVAALSKNNEHLPKWQLIEATAHTCTPEEDYHKSVLSII